MEEDWVLVCTPLLVFFSLLHHNFLFGEDISTSSSFDFYNSFNLYHWFDYFFDNKKENKLNEYAL